MGITRARRVLVVDDNEKIHEDFKKTLGVTTSRDTELAEMGALLFGNVATAAPSSLFAVDSAFTGEEGLEKVRRALEDENPYAMAFMDMRMPPGWDGLETILKVWSIDPTLQVVICTAYSDYSHEEIVERLGVRDNLLVLKKPFDVMEVRQLTSALTERWDIDRRMVRRLQELESIVAARTEELEREKSVLQESSRELGHARDDLERARLEAAAASSEKNEFLEAISDELRTPMAAILSFSEILLDGTADEHERLEIIRNVKTNSEYLLAIVNDILELTRIEIGKTPISMVPCSPFEVVECVRELMDTRARDKGLDLVIHYVNAIPERIVSDPARLRQMVLYLTNNAVRTTSEGTVLICVGFHEESEVPESGDVLDITVMDAGRGMTRDELSELLELISTEPGARPRKPAHGIGLTITRQIARILGGDLSIYSKPEVGSLFRVTVQTGDVEGVRRLEDPPADLVVPPIGVLRRRERLILEGRHGTVG